MSAILIAAGRRPAAAAVSVSVSPASQSRSFTTTNPAGGNFNFNSESITVTGGTPTSYNWYLENQTGGTWSIASGQGTAVCVARVNDAPDGFGSATLKCDVVVGGVTHTVTVNLSYTITLIG